MRQPRPSYLAVLLATLASCARPDPDFCCVTAETCAAAGLLDERRPCDVGQACRAYECIAAECRSSADCTSSAAPMCLAGLCVAGCVANDDCTGIAGRPLCDASDATCVGCMSNDQCSADQPICDADARSCRGCTSDDQCASGVCIEAAGTCASDGSIIYVTETGLDVGDCSRSAPCKTMQFAITLTSSARNVIRIQGAHLSLGNSSIAITGSIVIDGSNTTLSSGALPAIYSYGPGTLEGVRLSSVDMFTPLIKVEAGGNLKLYQATVATSGIEVSAGGTLDAFNVRLTESGLECSQGGELFISKSHLEQIYINSWCELVLTSNRIEPTYSNPYSVGLLGSMQVIQNNLFIGDGAGTYLIAVVGGFQNRFRFNTIVNTSPIASTSYALGCDDEVDVTSNIFAYNSSNPLSCVARHSLFDEAGALEAGRGTGNRVGNVIEFFKDRQSGDYHLSSDSPAVGFGEPGFVSTDLDGKARPMPSGTWPDVGAYEGP